MKHEFYGREFYGRMSRIALPNAISKKPLKAAGGLKSEKNGRDGRI
ncbi:MAG: hypothetical protein KJ727_04115 [Acidobacteria bacterium]|nr:hypothetical protein [Acidobacteriota bacterium]MBU4253768.1 hypothetical protein [Acidobacteriota bacterium]MBU4329439.1 hypothetical protein [Acidobacteriota bacterium]MBU4495674.1 hypothetical protein [Acidobacteriota bacterium]MCG2817136.1 hypothetical protein [Candidatus Aminicenantes bacterium]